MTRLLIDLALDVLAIAGFAVAAVTFMFNSDTPFQPGPLPFFGGLALGFGCVGARMARHIVWR